MFTASIWQPLLLFVQHHYLVRARRVHVHRHGPGAGRRLNENLPLPVVLSKTEEVSFLMHLKIHFAPFLNTPQT
ncbi:MAG: hypothetical protein JWQ87_1556 [Candidatus Sulfotelmatobacter sp.]|nr:hypothetical protein [Candidatus Sulfotelmatobacter sp.]